MKRLAIFWILVFGLTPGHAFAQPGLRGDYYADMNFVRKVFSRIDPQISFDWEFKSPGRGIPRSYYSVRWTGKLLAPVTGRYQFYTRVDDGIRVWIGNQKVVESWQLNDSGNYTGSILLEGGRTYDLRVDYFNDMLGGKIQLYWQRPDTKRLLFDKFTTPGELISAKYFIQKTPTPPPSPKPATPKTTFIVSVPPKTIPQKRLITNLKKPVVRPAHIRKTNTRDTSTAVPTPAPKPAVDATLALKPGQTVILRNVQFEQSSYVLLPESADELNQVVQAMNANPEWHIHVAGHTDNVGDPRLNVALSENRARVVANYLTRRGVNEQRITTEGFGGKQPITGNSTEGERSKNRRVEITIR
ncbi:OmpA family protein [Spirosoma sp. BT702]|uniref:OmpA family protein n=1 Tax=Spirosoma profusum TaxID=2771354 RepID=A0A926XT85_9BACT|nr:PA14 domain-containing protein [Spirosoma profusum]MBD2699204.1 OmpA family protein [Spirosoma profusum]